MKATELSCKDLMVGDWVMVYPWDETPWMPKKITDINFHSWEGADFCDSVGVEGWDELSLDQIKPIPLTPEILEKNGFRIEKEYDEIYDTHNYYATLSCVDLKKRNVEVNYSTFGNEITIFCHDRQNVLLSRSLETQINYVHQLQHALRLCEIEKEIEL